MDTAQRIPPWNQLDLLDNPADGARRRQHHTLGHLCVAGLVAFIVYEKLGVRILQRAWFNFDLLGRGPDCFRTGDGLSDALSCQVSSSDIHGGFVSRLWRWQFSWLRDSA